MIGKKLISYLIAGTLATGLATSVLNSDNMEKLKEALESTKEKINQYENNENYLVNKYGEIKENAESEIAYANSIIEEKNTEIEELKNKISEKENEIADLEKQLSNKDSNINELNNRIDELTTEINKLNDRINELNAEIDKLNETNAQIEVANEYIASTLDTVNNINNEATPLSDEELKSITGKLDVSIINPSAKNLSMYISKDNKYHVNFELTEDINISCNTSNQADIVIKLIDKDGKSVVTKNKIYEGYLNSNGNKYGKGMNIFSKLSNDLTPGKYSTTIKLEDSDKEIVKVELIVKNNDGIKTTLTYTR